MSDNWAGRCFVQQIFVIGADFVRFADAGADRRQRRRTPKPLAAGSDELEIAMLLRETVIERKAHEIEIGRARTNIEHVLNQDFVRQRLFLLGNVVLEFPKLALAETWDAVLQHPLTVEHRNLAIGARGAR